MHGGILKVLLCSVFFLFTVACAQKPPQFALKTDSNEKLKKQSQAAQIEKDKLELELRNQILLDALKERKTRVANLPKGQTVQPFPEFEELIYDQAKSAYESKDKDRLVEALRILKANQPKSKYLETIYFWLAQLQQERAEYSRALITYDEFLKQYPISPYAPQATFLKGQIYEKLNLKDQAIKIYTEVRKKFPHSREKHFADSKLENLKGNKR